MPIVEATKKYLLVKRAEMIQTLLKEDYSQVDIGIIFNVHKSRITDIINRHRLTKKTATSRVRSAKKKVINK